MMATIKTKNGDIILIDDEDFDVLSKIKWHLTKEGYAVTTLPRRHGHKPLCLHRVVMTPPDGLVVDHINGNPLDNRKENLRICTRAENNRNQKKSIKNSSGLKGVSWDKHRGKWSSKICVNEKRITLGRFDSKEDAYAAYCEAANKLHQEFANYG